MRETEEKNCLTSPRPLFLEWQQLAVNKLYERAGFEISSSLLPVHKQVWADSIPSATSVTAYGVYWQQKEIVFERLFLRRLLCKLHVYRKNHKLIV